MYKFTVIGKPAPQGSLKGFVRGGKVCMTSDNKNTYPWRQQVACMALLNRPTDTLYAPVGVPVQVRINFFFAKPTSYSKKVTRPVKKPDLDKLVRSCFDALTGVAFQDDSQVVSLVACKFFDDLERAEITVLRLDEGAENENRQS